MACVYKRDPAQCQGQVFVSLFFDGTGNNKDWNEPGLGCTQAEANKHSNVARLYDACIDKREEGIFAHYIPGVGTPFKEIGDYGGPLGLGAGFRGANRIHWAILSVLNSVHVYLTQVDMLPDHVMRAVVSGMSYDPNDPMRKLAFKTWENKLAKVVADRERKVTRINVAVFGFSRGAAAARAFAHWLFEFLAQKDGVHRLAGIPIRIHFMGLFDTVAAVGIPDGIPGADGHGSWGAHMAIHPAIEQCVHFIALHEQRGSFPLEMARGKQVAYPGMHSDVGGGYRPGDQGKAMPDWGLSPQLSQIPLIDMHHAALVGGVPLLSHDEIREDPGLARAFHCSPDLIATVNDFYATCGIAPSATGKPATQAFLEAHTHQYLQWRSGLYFPGQALERRRFYQRARKDPDQIDLREGAEDFATHHRSLRVAMRPPIPAGGRVGPSIANAPRVDAATARLLAALEAPGALPPSVHKLMDDYIHDSRCAFRPTGKMESTARTNGYFRYRTFF